MTDENVKGAPGFDEIRDAADRLAPLFSPTPMLRMARSGVWLKAENLQVTGSFKIRGAYNRISRLGETAGVIAASAGNHAQGVALAARMSGLPATIVMPEETPLIKVDRTLAHGAEVILHGSSFEDAYQKACDVGGERGLTFVHAYEDRDVMAGQGTIGLETLADGAGIETLVVPVGGGGLISGIAIAAKHLAPRVRVVGVQARGAAPTVQAFRHGEDWPEADFPQPGTMADAIRFKKASQITLPILREYVDDMIDVTEEEIAESIVLLMEEAKLVVEGAGAVGLAALMAGRVPGDPSKVCCIISGGNIDLNMTARVLEQGLSRASRYLVLRSQIPDKPGRLLGILGHLAERKINVLDVRHNRAGWRIPLGLVEVELLVETRNAEHAKEIIASLTGAGYEIERAERDPA